MKFGPFDSATLLLALILAAGTANGQQHPELGELINSGRLDEAQKQLNSYLASQPENPELLYWKAALEMRRGRPEDAERTLKAVVDSGKADPPHFLLLGQIYNLRQDWQRSAEVYRKGLARQYSPQMAFNLAQAEFQRKNYQAVVEVLEPLAENPQAEAAFHQLIGLAYFGLERSEDALPYLKKVLEERPEDASIHYDLALVHLQLRHFEEAIYHFNRTIRMQPDWARAHLFLGRALHDTNRSEDALRSFEEARRLKPDLPQLHHHFGLLYRGRGEFDKAVAEFEEEIATGYPTPATLFQLGDLLFNRGQFERSRKLLDKALEASPKNAEYRLLAAKLEIQAQQLGQAESHLQVALKDPLYAGRAYWQLGRLRQAQGRHREAKAAFEESRRHADQQAGRNPPK